MIYEHLDTLIGAQAMLLLGSVLTPGMSSPVEWLLAWGLAARKGTLWGRSVRANLQVIYGGTLSSEELDEAVFDVFRHATYCAFDLYRTARNPNRLDVVMPASPEMEEIIARNGQEGVMLIMPHLSNFDLALAAWAQRGLSAQLLSHGEPRFIYRIQNRIRSMTGLEVTPASDVTAMMAVERMRAGGTVITAVDRPLMGKNRTLNFFGRPSPLPAGHVQMALAAGVPIVVFAVHQLADRTYQIHVSAPIPMRDLGDKVATTRRNAEAVLEVIAEFITLAPRQWTMFYPVWPDAPESQPYLQDSG